MKTEAEPCKFAASRGERVKQFVLHSFSLSRSKSAELSRRDYFPLLDGLRCLSIVAVVWSHACGRLYVSGFLAHGSEGVSLFFVISGFLITTLLLRERSRVGEISLRRFYLRRTLRIFPLYYGVLALYVMLVWIIEKDSTPGNQFWHNLPFYLSYTSNLFVLRTDRVIFFFAWSLATEEQFYLLWPWVLKASNGPLVPLGTMIGLLILHFCSAQAVANSTLSSDWFLTRVLLSVSPPICLGAIAAFLVHYPTSSRWVQRLMCWRWSTGAALVTVLIFLAFDATPSWVLYTSMTWLIIACALRPDDWPLGQILTNPVIKHIGIVSYGIYLMHMLCINLVRRTLHLDDGVLLFAFALGVSIVVATISYRYFETPFLRLKDRLAKARLG